MRAATSIPACVDDGAGGAAQACANVTTAGDAEPAPCHHEGGDRAGLQHVGRVIHYTVVATNDGK